MRVVIIFGIFVVLFIFIYLLRYIYVLHLDFYQKELKIFSVGIKKYDKYYRIGKKLTTWCKESVDGDP